MLPSQTLSTKPVPGRKKDKTWITVLLDVNVTETDKLKPWVIGNAKRPRPLSKVNLECLPVFYHGNKKHGWILRFLKRFFVKWIATLEQKTKKSCF